MKINEIIEENIKSSKKYTASPQTLRRCLCEDGFSIKLTINQLIENGIIKDNTLNDRLYAILNEIGEYIEEYDREWK